MLCGSLVHGPTHRAQYTCISDSASCTLTAHPKRETETASISNVIMVSAQLLNWRVSFICSSSCLSKVIQNIHLHRQGKHCMEFFSHIIIVMFRNKYCVIDCFISEFILLSFLLFECFMRRKMMVFVMHVVDKPIEFHTFAAMVKAIASFSTNKIMLTKNNNKGRDWVIKEDGKYSVWCFNRICETYVERQLKSWLFCFRTSKKNTILMNVEYFYSSSCFICSMR